MTLVLGGALREALAALVDAQPAPATTWSVDTFSWLLCPAMAERGALRLIGTHPGAPGEVAVFESSAGETFGITGQTKSPSRGGASRRARPAPPLIQTEPACHVVESNATLATRHGPQLAVQPAA